MTPQFVIPRTVPSTFVTPGTAPSTFVIPGTAPSTFVIPGTAPSTFVIPRAAPYRPRNLLLVVQEQQVRAGNINSSSYALHWSLRTRYARHSPARDDGTDGRRR